LETQAYQAILERQPAQMIARLKEILTKPDPALGFINGELRFWLGWAQEVAGDHAAAQESWRQARSELEPFLKEQPDNYGLIGDMALTTMALGDKAAAIALAQRATATSPLEKDAINGPAALEFLARVSAQIGETDRGITAIQKLLSLPGNGPLASNMPLTPALLRLDPMFDPLRNDPRFQKLAVAKPSPAAPTVLSQREPPTASSAETPVPASLIAHPSGNVFSWKTNVATLVFWVGEEQVTGKTSPQQQSAWDKDWLKSFGGVDTPEPAARHDYIPISFVPHQNPFYCALPYNDVEQGRFKPEAPIVIPWFKRVHAEPGQSVCKDRWVAIRKANRICYAQWEDCGPFRTDQFQYVFQNERLTPNANNGAGLSVSPAVRDYLDLAPTDVADWRFVEVSDVPLGPWRNYGENNQFVIARRQLENNGAEQKESVNPAAMEPAQGATPADERVISSSVGNLEKGFAEQKAPTNPAPMEPAQNAIPTEESVMSSSAANLAEGLTEQKGSAAPAVTEPAQGATPTGEGVVSPSAAKLEKGSAERERSANQAAMKPAQANRARNQRGTSPSAAKAVTTYAPRPPYPQEAYSHGIAGSGVCVVSVDRATGSVTKVSMAESTGSLLLDKSVLSTVRTWKFKPGTVSKVSIPVEFTNDGDNR
jgi:TonB family protein